MQKPRARDVGIPFIGTPGKYNSITDVAGVEVGYSTLIRGNPSDYVDASSDFARTGITAILPRGKRRSAVFAGRHDLNGNGEFTGTHWIDDSGFLHGPVMLTNTNSVGIVRDVTSKWMIKNKFYYPWVWDGEIVEDYGYFYPAVGETWDGILNNINGFGIKEDDVWASLQNATGSQIEEGNVGGGTGMVCHDFKGGTGTASRVLSKEEGGYTVGVLVQANHGIRKEFKIKNCLIGDLIQGHKAKYNMITPKPGTGSIIVVVATDAPVLPWQLSKLCKRVPMGISAVGSYGENGSGDLFLAFSTANENAYSTSVSQITLLSDDKMDPLYFATAEAVEEAILNALFASETMEGICGNTVYGLPTDQVVEILKDKRII